MRQKGQTNIFHLIDIALGDTIYIRKEKYMKNASDIIFRLSIIPVILAVIVKIGYLSGPVLLMVAPLRIISCKPATYLIVTCAMLLCAIYLKLQESSK